MPTSMVRSASASPSSARMYVSSIGGIQIQRVRLSDSFMNTVPATSQAIAAASTIQLCMWHRLRRNHASARDIPFEGDRVRHLTHSGITLVTGGTGLIGGEVILALARSGEAVRAVVRGESCAHARRRLIERLEKSDAYSARLLPLIDAVAGDTVQPMFG